MQRCNKDHANHSAIVLCLEENTRNLPNVLNQFAVKCSVAALQKRGMYVIVSALPRNDLSPMQFVYLVLDEAVSRQMKQLAENILAYVGTNVGLPTELGVTETRLRSVMKQKSDEVKCEMKQQSAEVKQQSAEVKQQLEQTDDKVEQLASRLRKLEEALAEHEASRKRDHEALMAALAGLGAGGRQGEQEGGGEAARKRKKG